MSWFLIWFCVASAWSLSDRESKIGSLLSFFVLFVGERDGVSWQGDTCFVRVENEMMWNRARKKQHVVTRQEARQNLFMFFRA